MPSRVILEEIIDSPEQWSRHFGKKIDDFLSMCVASGTLQVASSTLSATELAPATCYLLPAPAAPHFPSAVWEQLLELYVLTWR